MAMNAFDQPQDPNDEWTKAAAEANASTPSLPRNNAAAQSFTAPSTTPGATSSGSANQTTTAPAPGQTAQQVVESLGVSPSLTGASATTAPSTQNTSLLGGGVSNWDDLVNRVTTAANPQDRMAAQDELARTLARELTVAGHQVEWDGSTMLVDGRAYSVAGDESANGATANPPTGGITGNAGSNANPNIAANGWDANRISSTNYNYMEGVDAGKMRDANVTTPKYVAARILASGGSVADAAAAVGGTVLDATRFTLPTGEIIDTRRDEEGANQLQWLVLGGDNGAPAGSTNGSSSLAGWGGSGTGVGYGLGQGGGFPASDPHLDNLSAMLAANPWSLSPQVVEQMKAKQAEEQMVAAQSADESLKRFGLQSGIMDSPWLASERAATARSADQGILQGRQNLDIQAAQTNTNDLRQSINTLTNLWAQKKDVYALNQQLQLEAARLGMSYEQFLMNLELQYNQLDERAAESYWGGN